MKRRDFIKTTSSVLAALGISEAGWLRLGGKMALAQHADRYYQAIALPAPRKLALLVGINQYPQTPALTGCLTDVELQRELLIHRFGFKESDIFTLTNQQATRQQIETAFVEHLIKQAQSDDVVLFHFSGYGRLVQLREPGEDFSSSLLNLNSLVPIDGVGPSSGALVANDLLEDTLELMLLSLSTSRVTTILDTSFNAKSGFLQGNLRIRSCPQLAVEKLSEDELAFRQQLQQNLVGANGHSLLQQKSQLKSSLPGVVLAAAAREQLATESQWLGFSAGLFTYALTQYLWEATPATTFQISLSRASGVVGQFVGKQQPQISSQNINEKSKLAYYSMPDGAGADGVVKLVEEDGKTVQLWLAGLPAPVLEYYEAGSKLTLLLSEESKIQLQVRSRTGLTAKAHASLEESTEPIQVGQLVQEAVRVLPRNINLIVALDSGLERIERVDATSAFAAIPHISVVIAGEQPADYLFSRVREAKTQQSSTPASSVLSTSRYGLFSLGQELIPNTAGEAGEAVKVAVKRLAPKLQTLLAAKLWRLTLNEGSSRLGMKATLNVVNTQERVLMQRETLRVLPQKQNVQQLRLTSSTSTSDPCISIGSRILYRIYNCCDRPIYFLLIGLDSSRNAIALYPTAPGSESQDLETKPQLENIVIAPGETFTLPQSSASFEWVMKGPSGLAETQLIFSTKPFTRTLAALGDRMHPPRSEQQHVGALLNPLEVAQAVLQDLNQASLVKTDLSPTANDTYALDVNTWASLSFVYQVG